MKRADFLSLPRVVAMTALAIAVSRPIALHAQVHPLEEARGFKALLNLASTTTPTTINC
jgi:hypothetical protein